jgi:hypothetical protein
MTKMVQRALGLVFNLYRFSPLLSYLVLRQIFWDTVLLLIHELIVLIQVEAGCSMLR